MKTGKIKEKVAAKVARGKGRIERKVAKGKAKVARKVAAIAALFGILAFAGCMGTQTPSRSQTLTISDSTVNIYGTNGGETNDVPRVEIASQAMQIENSGSESQSAAPTQTTDVKPDIDVTATKGGAGGGILESVLRGIASPSGSDSAKTTDSTDACAGGSCGDNACAGGACSR